MAVTPTTGIHIARPKIVSGDQLKPGDIISDLTEPLRLFGLICNIRGDAHLRLDPRRGSDSRLEDTIHHLGSYSNDFLLLREASVVPFLSPASFGAAGQSLTDAIALIGDEISFFGFYRSAGMLIDSETGEINERDLPLRMGHRHGRCG